MDEDWTVSRITRENKDKAWRQLGTSGSGNHFVEFGLLTLNDNRATTSASKRASMSPCLSHSGSRGTGASVCSTYSAIARARLPKRYEQLGRLAWLDMNTQEGQEYWAAMNLMGDYAAANHAVIHRNVAKLLGAKSIAGVENHHNFAWKERHGGEDVYRPSQRRDARRPRRAGRDPRLDGRPRLRRPRAWQPRRACNSASHGAGRCMSRTAAKEQIQLSRGAEGPGANRASRSFRPAPTKCPASTRTSRRSWREQQDLVEVVARFDPKIVKMCGDGSAAED